MLSYKVDMEIGPKKEKKVGDRIGKIYIIRAKKRSGVSKITLLSKNCLTRIEAYGLKGFD